MTVLAQYVADVASSYRNLVETVFSSTIAAKAWLASVALLLAIIQIITAARLYGRLAGVVPLSAKTVAKVHRWSGRLAILISLPVVFHCVFILGFQTSDARVLTHSLVGTFFYGVFAAKMVIVKNHGFPGWALPVAGGVLFTALVVLWATSSFWYFTEVRFGL